MKALARLPIQARIAVTIFIASASCLLLAAAGIYFVFHGILIHNLDESLRDRATANGSLVASVGVGPGLTAATPSGSRGSGTILRVYRADGTLVSDASPSIPLNPVEQRLASSAVSSKAKPSTADYREGPYRIVARPQRRPDEDLVVITGLRYDAVSEPLAALRLVLVLVVPSTSLLLGGASLIIARRAFRPVRAITAAANAIASGDLDQRIAATSSRDEVGELATTFNRMIGRLAETIERERRFTADAAHELRTPLAGMTTAVEITLGQSRPAAEYRRALESVREQTSRLARLTQQLLLLSRMEAGAEVGAMEPVELRGLLVATVEAFKTRHEGDSKLTLETGKGDLPIEGNIELLARAFTNVLDNAVVHGAARAGSIVNISVNAAREGDTAVVTIRDDGPGLPDSVRDSAFLRFRRGSDSRATGGSGLGLAIVEAITKAHNGVVEALRERSGTAIEFRFPIS